MIDIENEISALVRGAVLERYPGADVSGQYVRAPARFPHVSVLEADNAMYEPTQDSGGNENHARVMYEVNVYSNKSGGGKQEAKQIFQAVDEALSGAGLTRTFYAPAPNLENASIHRITARYQAVISKNHMIYRR